MCGDFNLKFSNSPVLPSLPPEYQQTEHGKLYTLDGFYDPITPKLKPAPHIVTNAPPLSQVYSNSSAAAVTFFSNSANHSTSAHAVDRFKSHYNTNDDPEIFVGKKGMVQFHFRTEKEASNFQINIQVIPDGKKIVLREDSPTIVRVTKDQYNFIRENYTEKNFIEYENLSLSPKPVGSKKM